MRHYQRRRRSCKLQIKWGRGGTDHETWQSDPQHKNSTDMAKRHASNQERHEGTSQLERTPHTYRSNKKLKLRTMGTDARSFNSMPAKAAAMLFLKKGTQFEVYLVGL